MEIGFVSVDDYVYFNNFNPEFENIKKIKLVHEPSKCDIDDGSVFNLFGHIHGRQLCKKFGLDVGVDGHHMRPISQEDILFYFTAIKKHYDNEVFM